MSSFRVFLTPPKEGCSVKVMIEAVLEQPQAEQSKPRKAKQKRINVALAGVIAATTELDWSAIAPHVGAKNGESLRQVMIRKGVTRAVIEAAKHRQPVNGSVTAKLVTQATAAIQDMLNDEIADQIRTVRAVPVVYNDLANEKQGRAGLVKQIAESYRAINGSPDQISIQFGASMLSEAVPGTVTDVVATPLPVEEKPINIGD